MDFKDKVIEIVNKIPKGKVTTYGTVATLAGMPRGALFIGCILHCAEEQTPWYRVINRNGLLSIKCYDHPRQLQKALLASEGIKVSDDFMIDLQEYGWWG